MYGGIYIYEYTHTYIYIYTYIHTAKVHCKYARTITVGASVTKHSTLTLR